MYNLLISRAYLSDHNCLNIWKLFLMAVYLQWSVKSFIAKPCLFCNDWHACYDNYLAQIEALSEVLLWKDTGVPAENLPVLFGDIKL